MGSIMCDCFTCRQIRPNGPRAKDDGRTGEHLCANCLNRPSCANHPMNNRKDLEDLPDLEDTRV